MLQSVRKLKALGIETQFLTANMTSMGNSEFVLTIFGALAQEESANTSKRIKFGKKMNAEKGRVPNIVYGYDKTIGDYFNLSINEEEAKVIRQMYKWYTEEGFGGAKIANMLNERGIKTKRGNNWSQNSVCRILTNEIYTGKIINGKEEVADFLTGQRKGKDESEWLVTIRPELRIIDDEIFDRAQEILKGRHDSFKMTHERQSNKHLFSTLIKCKDCGWSFRRTVRQYKNTYVRWVCSGHNGRGADSCPNAITVDEEELIQVLQEYFQDVLSKKKKVIDHVIKEFQRVYKAKDENVEYEKELTAELNRLRKAREKYMDMYTDDLISREELNEKIGGMRKEIDRLENELKMVSYNLTKGEQLEAILNSTFKEMEDITDVHEMTNTQLKRLINKIEVDKDGNVDIYLRLIGDLGLDETVFIEGAEDSENNTETSLTQTVPNCTNHTNGNFNIINKLKECYTPDEQIIIYLDLVPGSKRCRRAWVNISNHLEEKNYKNVLLLPIVCIEYIVIRHIVASGVSVVAPNVLSALQDAIKLDFTKAMSTFQGGTLERKFKDVLDGSRKACLRNKSLPDNIDMTAPSDLVFAGKYYLYDCNCGYQHCAHEELLKHKALGVYSSLPYFVFDQDLVADLVLPGHMTARKHTDTKALVNFYKNLFQALKDVPLVFTVQQLRRDGLTFYSRWFDDIGHKKQSKVLKLANSTSSSLTNDSVLERGTKLNTF